MISKSEILFKPLEKEKIEELKDVVTKPTSIEEIFGLPLKKKEVAENVLPLDLKVGKIEKVESHPNAHKLYVLQINFGKEKRQIVSGLKEFYTKEDLENRKIVAVLNLKSAVIRGIESKGMILTGEDKNILGLLSPKKSEPGDQIIPDGYTLQAKEIDIKQFSELLLFIKGGKATFEGKPLKTKHEVIEVERVKEGKIR